MCGEQRKTAYGYRWKQGSPPRVRGTDELRLINEPIVGITPACAGNSPLLWFNLERRWDHPRVCGEQSRSGAGTSFLAGSPPRVRGTGKIEENPESATRITPACAGNRGRLQRKRLGNRDHPRVCGEQSTARVILSAGKGSPPRVRGTGNLFHAHDGSEGITPACAGNRVNSRHCLPPFKDHPRVCGEQLPS